MTVPGAEVRNAAQLPARLVTKGTGEIAVDTGIPVLDHLLSLLARYASFDLALEVAPGSAREQIEAAGRAFGRAVGEAIAGADSRGHGLGAVPTEEALASVALDRSDRPIVVSNADLSGVHVAGLETDVIASFLEDTATEAGLAIHVRLAHGDDERHVLDSIFKSLGVALAEACGPALAR